MAECAGNGKRDFREELITFEEQGNKILVNIHSVFESAEQLKEVIKVFKADEGMKQNQELPELNKRFEPQPYIYPAINGNSICNSVINDRTGRFS